MSGHDHEHGHGHLDDPAHPHNAPLSEVQLRVRALESLLTEKGLVDPAALDELIDTYETKIGPRNGARVVARASGHLPPGPGEAALRGTLEERLFLGAIYRHYVRVEGETVMVDGAQPAEPGPVTIRLPAAKLQVYAAPEPAG